MLRFSWAYQGGGGATYLAGGATIDLEVVPTTIDLESEAGLDAAAAGLDIDLVPAGAKLDITNDAVAIDLQG